MEGTNRANHERRTSTAGWQTELTKPRKGLKQMLQVIENGDYTRGMVERLAKTLNLPEELLDFAASRGAGSKNTNTPGAGLTGVSVSLVAGAGFEPAAFRL